MFCEIFVDSSSPVASSAGRLDATNVSLKCDQCPVTSHFKQLFTCVDESDFYPSQGKITLTASEPELWTSVDFKCHQCQQLTHFMLKMATGSQFEDQNSAPGTVPTSPHAHVSARQQSPVKLCDASAHLTNGVEIFMSYTCRHCPRQSASPTYLTIKLQACPETQAPVSPFIGIATKTSPNNSPEISTDIFHNCAGCKRRLKLGLSFAETANEQRSRVFEGPSTSKNVHSANNVNFLNAFEQNISVAGSICPTEPFVSDVEESTTDCFIVDIKQEPVEFQEPAVEKIVQNDDEEVEEEEVNEDDDDDDDTASTVSNDKEATSHGHLQCRFCEVRFTNGNSRTLHEMDEHPGKLLKCHHCKDRRFASIRSLRCHQNFCKGPPPSKSNGKKTKKKNVDVEEKEPSAGKKSKKDKDKPSTSAEGDDDQQQAAMSPWAAMMSQMMTSPMAAMMPFNPMFTLPWFWPGASFPFGTPPNQQQQQQQQQPRGDRGRGAGGSGKKHCGKTIEDFFRRGL